MYLIESTIFRGEVGALVLVESLQTLFGVLTGGLSNFCETSSLITSSSASGVRYVGLPVIGSYFAHMESKAKLNVEYT